ncbi:MAG: S8 family serine peptidase [Candidatus Pacebacteria bacterium]|nr:S8 family serine peptidase [Candidatus Paceibacterota bacterium]
MKKIFFYIFFLIFFAFSVSQLASALEPNDVFYKRQWYLEKIKAPGAWERTSSATNVVVAIIDSGVQINHADLKDNIWNNQGEIPNNGIDDDKNGFIDDINGWDFVSDDGDPSPDFKDDIAWTEGGISHGTVIAGIIAAKGNNKEGVSGIAWETQLMPLKVLNEVGAGNIKDVVRAMDYAVKNGANIINLSFVGLDYNSALQAAIERAYKQGVLIVAAAGNENSAGEGYNVNENPLYPVCNDGSFGQNMIIGVAATDTLDQKTPFSSYGSNCVDISAPGVSFFSTVAYNNSFAQGRFNKQWDGYWSGTSMAAPVVSGSLALILAANPNIDRKEAIDILLSSADDIKKLNPDYIGQLGAGRVNVDRAVNIAHLKLNSFVPKIITTPFSSLEPKVKLYSKSGKEEVSFLAYQPNFLKGVNLASADLNNNGSSEIITGAKAGGGPQVRIFNGQGQLLRQFFAFDSWQRFGVEVSGGDVNGDGLEEIVVSPDSNYRAELRIYNYQGELLSSFLAFPASFTGGVNLAVGDIDGDGISEIIVGAGAGGGPQVRIFNNQGKLLGQFFAYDKNSRQGVRVAVANLDGLRSLGAKIITAPGKNQAPYVKIFNSQGELQKKFLAYAEKFQGGVSLATGDINNNGFDDIIVGAGPGGSPHVRVFSGQAQLLESFYAGSADLEQGIEVSYLSLRR